MYAKKNSYFGVSQPFSISTSIRVKGRAADILPRQGPIDLSSLSQTLLKIKYHLGK